MKPKFIMIHKTVKNNKTIQIYYPSTQLIKILTLELNVIIK